MLPLFIMRHRGIMEKLRLLALNILDFEVIAVFFETGIMDKVWDDMENSEFPSGLH